MRIMTASSAVNSQSWRPLKKYAMPGIEITAASEASDEYLVRVATDSQIAQEIIASFQSIANITPREVATPLPPRKSNQIGAT